MWFSLMDKSFPVMENKITESDFVFVLVFYPHPSRQLQQQQQQAELQGGETREGMYEAGQITHSSQLSQVSPHCPPLVRVAIFLKRLSVTQRF